MLFSTVNSAIYTQTFSRANVFAQRAYLRSLRAIKANREFTTYYGARMSGNIGDYVITRIFSFGVWEPNLSRFMEDRITSDTWAVDVGAHVGYFTLLMSALAHHGKVTAIEASPSNYKELSRHIVQNERQNVMLINKAVAASRGETKLFNSSFGDKNTGNHSLIEPENATGYTIVKADTLLNILGADARRVSFIKIDIEGAERPVLEEIIANHGSFAQNLTVVAEVNDTNLDLVDRFQSAGFKCSVLDNFYGLEAYLAKRADTPKPWVGSRHPAADLIFERRGA